jgi:hypothetical protein
MRFGEAAPLGGGVLVAPASPELAAIARGQPVKSQEQSMTKLNQGDRDELSSTQFAFEKQRKEPLENANHVRNAVARFNQVKDVSDTERDAAWKRIKAAAKKHDVELHEKSWRELTK